MLCASCGFPTSTEESSSAREKESAANRRREQNRRAQQRFRQKHRQRKSVPEQDNSNAQPNSNSDVPDEGSPRTTGALTPPSTMYPSRRPSSIGQDEENRPDAVIDWDLFLDPNESSGFGLGKGSMDDFWTTALKDTASLGDATTVAVPPSVAEECRGHHPHTTTNPSDPVKNTDHGGKAQGGQTVLHRAVQTGNSKVVRLLLEHNAECNSKDHLGLTPLLYAIVGGHEDVVELLLSHGAGIGHVDNAHGSALHWAVMHDRPRILKRLLKACVGDLSLLNRQNKDGETPLSVSVSAGSEVAVKLLLESGATVNVE
ncbi:Ankyrin repeat-containing protein [Apiospora marii]|uniref:Ankyrin repeat-containing protein n=1 Tax=Apiospora marii TaxID=335849 RepID=UPI00312F58E7